MVLLYFQGVLHPGAGGGAGPGHHRGDHLDPSDHGGDPYRKRHPDKSGFRFLRIPLILFVSEEYKNLYRNAVEIFENHKNRYFSNDLMYELVCEVLQIKSNSYDESASLLNKKYRFDENTLTTNLGKTKLVEDRDAKDE